MTITDWLADLKLRMGVSRRVRSRRIERQQSCIPAMVQTLQQRVLPTAVSVSASATTVNEGDHTYLTFTRDDMTDSLNVDLNITGNATNGTDYTSISSKITFGKGDKSETLDITAFADGVTEMDETFTVAVLDGAGYKADSKYGSTTVTIHDPAAQNLAITFGAPSAINEGQSVTITGTATDTQINSVDLTIDWGDGTKADTLSVSGANKGATFSDTHTYLDNPTGSDHYNITVTGTDSKGNKGSHSESAKVSNVDPSFTGNLSLSATSLPGQGKVSLTGNFTDPGTPDTFLVNIDWGDGTTEKQSLSAGAKSFSGDHPYAASTTVGQYQIQATVTDDDGGTATAKATVRNECAPTLTASAPSAVNEGQSLTLSGTVFDPNGDNQTVVINWGDNTSDTITLFADAAGTAYSKSHTYLDDNPTNTSSDQYTITVTATDATGLTATQTAKTTVNNVAPTISGGLTLSATSLPQGQGQITVSSNITDPGTQDTFVLTINWGDGSPNSIQNLTAGSTSFSADHTYAQNTAVGQYQIQATLTDDDGGTVTANATVTNNRPPVFAASDPTSFTINENWVGNLPTITFTDPDVGDSVTYEIDYAASGPMLDGTNVATNFSINNDGVLTLCSPLNYESFGVAGIQPTVTLVIMATDTHGLSVSNTFVVNVSDVPELICGTDGDYNSLGGDVVRVSIAALLANDTDVDATIDPTTFRILNPGSLTIRRVDDDLLISPPVPAIGANPVRYEFTYQVSDSKGETGTGIAGVFVFGTTLKTAWIATINQEEAKSIGYMYYATLGLADVYTELRSAANGLADNAYVFGNTGTANAVYSPFWNTVTVMTGSTAISADTVIHETIHIVDRNHGWYLNSTGIPTSYAGAERLAWAGQNFLMGSSSPLSTLRSFEDYAFSGSTPDEAVIQTKWGRVVAQWTQLVDVTYTYTDPITGSQTVPIQSNGWANFLATFNLSGLQTVALVYQTQLSVLYDMDVTLSNSYTDPTTGNPPTTYTVPAGLW